MIPLIIWIHTILMLLAFVIFFPASILVARYQKQLYTSIRRKLGPSRTLDKLLSLDPLEWHIILAATGAFLCFVSISILFLLMETHMNTWHSYLGIFLCFILIFSQPGSGATIYDGKLLFLASWHRTFGYILYGMAWFNIMLGFYLIYGDN